MHLYTYNNPSPITHTHMCMYIKSLSLHIVQV